MKRLAIERDINAVENKDLVARAVVDVAAFKGHVFTFVDTCGISAAIVNFRAAHGQIAAPPRRDDPDEDVCAPTIAISAVGEDEEAYRLALQAVISSCRNEPVQTEADKLLANIGSALATGDLYNTDGASHL